MSTFEDWKRSRCFIKKQISEIPKSFDSELGNFVEENNKTYHSFVLPFRPESSLYRTEDFNRFLMNAMTEHLRNNWTKILEKASQNAELFYIRQAEEMIASSRYNASLLEKAIKTAEEEMKNNYSFSGEL